MTPESPFLCRSCRSPLAGLTKVPPSPIYHLFGTNKVPSDSETQYIRSSIAASQLDISRLDADIARTQSVLERLTREREALKEYVNDHAAFLTTARRVPAEIWSEVFMHCLPTTTAIVGGPGQTIESSFYTEPGKVMCFSPQIAPALLLRICKEWTTIALSSPRLWSLIDLRLSSSFLDLPQILVQNWLRRSRQAPLSVILSNTSCSPITFFRSPAVRTLLEQSHRWQVVHMQIWQPPMDVFAWLQNNVPELEELHLQFEYTNRSQPQPKGMDMFWNAPKLHRVTISGFPHYPIANTKLPWAQLTHFSLKGGESIIGLRALLQSAPNLLEVDWSLSEPVHTNSQLSPSMTVQHPHLCDLSVFLYGDPGSSFNSFSLPSLRKLSIKTSRRFKALPWKLFGLFISRNCQALESFQLNADLKNISELIACLKALPALSELTLTISGRYAEMKKLLQSLRYTRGVSVMLPALKMITVELEIPLKDSIIGTKFIDMIESRCQASSLSHSKQVKSINQLYISHMRWASLTVHGGTLDLTAEDNRRLQNLGAQGLAVQVYSKC